MKKLLFLLVSMAFATVAMAQDGHSGVLFAPSIGMALGAGLCGLGQGKAISAACEGIARNPGAAGNIRTTMIIGLVLIESLALYTLAVAWIKG